MATRGQWLLSSDPRSVDIRETTRAERCSLADAHQVIRACLPLSRCLPICVLWGASQIDLLCANVDQNVLARVATLQVSPVPLVNSAPGPRDFSRIEAHGPTLSTEASGRQRILEDTLAPELFGLYQPLTTTWRMYDNSIHEPRLIAAGAGAEALEVRDADLWQRIVSEATR